MPTFEDPVAEADEAQQALRGLAHATRAIDSPRQIYPNCGRRDFSRVTDTPPLFGNHGLRP